jgi:hypothetical protein
MKKIVGRKLGSGEKVNGYGLKFVNNETVIITDNGEEPIIPSSLFVEDIINVDVPADVVLPPKLIVEVGL